MNDIQKGLQTVVNKAWDDAQFKSKLIANPKSAIQSATGLSVPADVKIVVNDQTNEETVYLNIPPKPDYDNMELTDEQMEQVAGGEVVLTTFAVTMATAAASVVTVSTTIVAVGNNKRNKRQGKKHW